MALTPRRSQSGLTATTTTTPIMQLRSLPVGRLTLSEISGSLGDLGILIPLLVGMAHQGSVHFVPALFFAGLWNFATGLLWDVPMCVQPMKTIAAVALADGLSRVQVSLAGLLFCGVRAAARPHAWRCCGE